MKKILVFLVVLALAIPSAALAATEFSLGGYIKLDTFWDSTQNNSLIAAAPARSNDVRDSHGRFNMRAQESRFNFTIKGPKLWGAQTTGFIEMDFDGYTDNPNAGAGTVGASGTWLLRLRHAMFRLNWPETELLMGQYWGLFSNWWIEGADDGPFIPFGSALDRIPQIRVTQKFAGDWSVAGLIGLPGGANLSGAGQPYSGVTENGQNSETPQLQGNVTYSHDWWGKAAYYGVPKAFTATVSAGWQRSVYRRDTSLTLQPFGQKGYDPAVAGVVSHNNYLNPWMVQGALFIPVLPTHSANLAGTASILTEAFVGQGVEVFGILGGSNSAYANANNPFHYLNTVHGVNYFDAELAQRFGWFVQGQYYFTNQWFLNAAYGMTRIYGITRNGPNVTSPDIYATTTDPWRSIQTVDATLWYRPIQALKFGLQYTYNHGDYFQITNSPGATAHSSPNYSQTGDEHRVEFVGYFFF